MTEVQSVAGHVLGRNRKRLAIPSGRACHDLQREWAMSDDAEVMSRGRVLGFGAYLIVLNLALVYILLKIWPETLPVKPDDENVVALLWGGRLAFRLLPEIRFLLIVAVAGALGSYIHLATSFADYV